jgi:hypothetical protein
MKYAGSRNHYHTTFTFHAFQSRACMHGLSDKCDRPVLNLIQLGALHLTLALNRPEIFIFPLRNKEGIYLYYNIF